MLFCISTLRFFLYFKGVFVKGCLMILVGVGILFRTNMWYKEYIIVSVDNHKVNVFQLVRTSYISTFPCLLTTVTGKKWEPDFCCHSGIKL